MILVDPDSGSGDGLTGLPNTTYFVTGTNHILLERYGSGSAPFPYILIYNVGIWWNRYSLGALQP